MVVFAFRGPVEVWLVEVASGGCVDEEVRWMDVCVVGFGGRGGCVVVVASLIVVVVW